MAAFDLPTFDYQTCQSTGWCIAICPTDCLDMWNDRPGILYPQACISCAACEVICPTQAIVVGTAKEDRAHSVETGTNRARQ